MDFSTHGSHTLDLGSYNYEISSELNEIEELKAKIKDEQQEFSSLGIFKFKRKEELRISIEDSEKLISIKEKEIISIKNKFLDIIKDLDKKAMKNK